MRAGDSGPASFFKRGHATRGNARTLFTTITYQLALNVEWLRAPISQLVEQNPSIVARSMATQMQELISKPCRAQEHHDAIVILIDGLDECDGYGVQGEILRTIRSPSLNLPLFLRFMVASRPEPQIHQVFYLSSFHYCSFNVEQSFDDVRKYLRDEFSRIHRNHSTMQNILSPWPTCNVLEELVRKSSGYFIYASTIIKFIGDEDHRPTVRLEVVQNVNGPGSESAYDALDQLYMTILRSVPRQSELIPILCAISNFELCPEELDKLFRLAEGEALLLLRGLHSVLKIQASEDKISSHHASFVDFLRHPDRSGTFCIDILNIQIGLARSFLQFYAGPFQRTNRSVLSRLINFVVLLPPSDAVAELFVFIASVNPDYIFDPMANLYNGELASIASWLKNTPSAPADVIQLWENYAFMSSMNAIQWSKGPSVQHIDSPSPELLRILILMRLLDRRLEALPTKLDLTWTNLRSTLCSLRPKLTGNEHMLPVRQPQAAYSLSRLRCDVSRLVRLSPPCPVLYRELWSIPPSEIWSSQTSGYKLIHHVSKWLESFPDSTMELITFWQQAGADPELHDIDPCNPGLYNPGPVFWEKYWRDRIKHYNDMIT
ncbi:putative nwd2 protein [Mycena sanguinolenta]|uniref:Putative nwd2 protein n=1 Tax=Mycena sanguinolenta TaxID=230812 RepID=A0A8H6ZAU6_9AGAR|nr:putative nwd2 protein [Mycena sanguinolenta]